MANFLLNYLCYGVFLIGIVTVTVLLIAGTVLVVKTIKGFIEDII